MTRSSRRTDLLLGLRLAVGGGRDGWSRLLLTAVAAALGVALLLLGAAIPGIDQHRNERIYVQNDTFTGSAIATRTDRTALIAEADTTFRGQDIRGRLVQPEGANTPAPPGLTQYPPVGSMAVSPALERLLRAPGSELLRERLPYPVTAIIGDAGLLGPAQLSYVLTSDHLSTAGGAVRIDRYGARAPHEPMRPILILLSLVGMVVLLAPVGVFLASAARFGSERRDRRLAALRLAGADRGTTRWIAAGESLAGALLGAVLGVGFYLAGRQLAERFTFGSLSVFPQDITVQPLVAVLVLLAVPVLSVAATLLSLRRIAVEPLGVVRRQGGARRRLWWRLALPVLGLLVLLFAVRSPEGINQGRSLALVAGALVLLLVGSTALLPWLVDSATRRAPVGGLPWQLAVRRLQLATGPATTAVNGIVVAVAGAIALQSLFLGVSDSYYGPSGAPTARQQDTVAATVRLPGSLQAGAEATALRRSPGVRSAVGYVSLYLAADGGNGASTDALVADCATLRTLAALPHCTDGEVFDVEANAPDAGTYRPVSTGTELSTLDPGGRSRTWRVPAGRSTVTLLGAPAAPGTMPGPLAYGGLMITPAAAPAAFVAAEPATLKLSLDPGVADVRDQLRTSAARLSPQATVVFPDDPTPNPQFHSLSQALAAGIAVTLLLIAGSLLVGQLERLREQNRVLAVLYAFGTRRRILALSVLLQSALPMALGLLVALCGGLAAGAALLRLGGLPIGFDWSAVATMCAAGAAAVLLTTLLSLPVLLRTMRPAGLRFE
ncbi:FtsX-like permease family protein [Streptacidiphilus sp. N1-10]|uniref:FtsX-like permease family protein n=1 Tax=Streptacidiphilus jeojiensis TaxID=3229225 RepID=A0ABV6XPI4_9ACTN